MSMLTLLTAPVASLGNSPTSSQSTPSPGPRRQSRTRLTGQAPKHPEDHFSHRAFVCWERKSATGIRLVLSVWTVWLIFKLSIVLTARNRSCIALHAVLRRRLIITPSSPASTSKNSNGNNVCILLTRTCSPDTEHPVRYGAENGNQDSR